MKNKMISQVSASQIYGSMTRALAVSAVLWVAAVAPCAYADNPVAVPAGSPASAQGAAAGTGAAQSPPSTLGMLAPFLMMAAVFYFLMIRPQQKKMKEQTDMLSNLKHGDEVVTASGILGKVTGITEKVVTVEIADDVRIKMLKSQVGQVIKGSVKDLSV